jgi:mannose-6-phosphate isomerase-like protein (cupin superfamily)
MKVVQKQWGHEKWFCNTPSYCAKELVLEPGWRCSLHYHREKCETFVVLSGWCSLELQNKDSSFTTKILEPFEEVLVLPGRLHRFSLPPDAKQSCSILEVSTHHEDSDSYRVVESSRVE